MLAFLQCPSSLILLWVVIGIMVIGNFQIANSELSADFREFLDEHYGMGSATRFERADLGRSTMGSFGGRNTRNEPIIKQPIIFVHGTTLRAGIFLGHRNYFREQGYTDAELYATSYSDGGITPFYANSMRCEDVKLIREFISAVYEYSNETKVDIISYSMGVAISRKAIMGGRCVDTGEYLGRPITQYVDTYLGIAGIAYGMENCPLHKNYQACNEINGMNCVSEYLKDINSKDNRYEGDYSYALYSKNDYLAGQNCCGHHCSEIKNANANIARQYYDHFTIFTSTKEIQYNLVVNHRAEN